MKAYSIDPKSKKVKEIDIDMQPNTVYTFFSSILIDELNTLENHTVHSDGEAISKEAIPFFIGDQLVVGEALIIGKNGIEEIDASIPKDDLALIINYDVSDFYVDALKMLKSTDINLYRVFEIKKEEELIQLNTEWVLYVFNMADDKTKEYFLSELKKAVASQANDAKSDILEHIQKMAILALQAGA